MGKEIIRSYFIFNFLYSFFPRLTRDHCSLWQDIGLTMSEIALINGLFLSLVLFFEIPTGIVAIFWSSIVCYYRRDYFRCFICFMVTAILFGGVASEITLAFEFHSFPDRSMRG